MTYGQRQRSEERKMERAMNASRAWYESLSEAERTEFDRKAQAAKAQLLAARTTEAK